MKKEERRFWFRIVKLVGALCLVAGFVSCGYIPWNGSTIMRFLTYFFYIIGIILIVVGQVGGWQLQRRKEDE